MTQGQVAQLLRHRSQQTCSAPISAAAAAATAAAVRVVSLWVRPREKAQMLDPRSRTTCILDAFPKRLLYMTPHRGTCVEYFARTAGDTWKTHARRRMYAS